MFRLSILLCASAVSTAIKHRNVTFWYTPAAYGGGDIATLVELLTNHSDTVGSVILECKHSINSSHPLGVNCAEPYDELDKTCKSWTDTCLKTAEGLTAANINVELLVAGPDGAGSGPATNWTPAAFEPENATIFATTMIDVAKRFNATGVNVDSEPDQGGGPTIRPEPYAAYLATLKPLLNAAGLRLTADVAAWCAMTKDYALLAPHVDRLLNMEQYNANSLDGWLKGDAYGGYYEQFLEAAPVDKVGPGLGIWAAACGKNASGAAVPCWTTLEESGAPRVDRMIADNVPEMAMFRLMWIGGAHQPAAWWWPLLDKFATSPLN